MSDLTARLQTGRRHLHHKCDALETMAVAAGHPSTPWQTLRQSIDEVEVRVVVVGEVNRGKSTFLNALMGAKVFPPRATVCTAVLTELRDGEPSVEIVKRDGPAQQRTLGLEGVAKILRGVVSKKNEDAQNLERVRLSFPNAFARHGVVLIDTPGVNDPVIWREEITRKAVQQADAAIFLLDPQTPLRQTERMFLQETVHHRVEDRILFVVTKVDQVSPQELSDAMDRLRTHLSQIVRNPRILPVASKQALAAREAGDAEAFAASGFQACEQELIRFLTEERVELELTARKKGLHHQAAVVQDDLRLRVNALASEDSQLRRKLADARHELKRRATELKADRVRRKHQVSRTTKDMAEAATDAWNKAAQTHLLSNAAMESIVQAFRAGMDTGKAELRDRAGKAHREAERTVYPKFQQVAQRALTITRPSLQLLTTSMTAIQEAVSGPSSQQGASLATTALSLSAEAFSEANKAQRIDTFLLAGAAGIVTGLFGLFTGAIEVAAQALTQVARDPGPAVRTLIRQTERQGKKSFVRDVEAQANGYVASELKRVDKLIDDAIAKRRQSLDSIERAIGQDRSKVELEAARLRKLMKRVSHTMETLT